MKMTIELDVTLENLKKLEAFCEETGTTKKSKTSAKKQDAPKSEATKTEEKDASKTEPITEVTLTDVRAVALKLSKAGQQAKLKEIFGKYGAAKLSEVKAEDYATLMEDLNNAC